MRLILVAEFKLPDIGQQNLPPPNVKHSWPEVQNELAHDNVACPPDGQLAEGKNINQNWCDLRLVQKEKL